MWLTRSKLFLIVILLCPFVLGSSFQHIAGIPELLGYYGTSLLYGISGLVFGVLYADYARVKRYFKRASKLAFLARGGIALSSIYLISYFGQKIIFENPMVEFALGFIEGGNEAKALVDQIDYDGAVTAGICLLGSFGLLGYSSWREGQKLITEEATPKALEKP